MTRLFRKFFIFVWLAMTVSIVGIISLDRVFHLFPLKSERQQERISFVLQTIGEVLEQKAWSRPVSLHRRGSLSQIR